MSAHSAVLSGADKAALVLLSLPADQRSRLLSAFSREEAAQLSQRLAGLSETEAEVRRLALREFRRALTSDPEATPVERSRPEAAPRPDCSPTDRKRPKGEVSAFDLSILERVPTGARGLALGEGEPDLAGFASLPVPCRVELASLSLPAAALCEVEVGDVIVLKPVSEAGVELVGGENCRINGRPGSEQGWRTFEIPAAPAEGSR